MRKRPATLTFEELIGAPEYLYHYTSIQGVDGILKNRLVWASVLHFLNDSREWRYAIELAQIQLLRRIDDRPGYTKWNRLLRELVTSLEHTEFDICIFSLSAMANQLSQWRGYCPLEGGYAIRFRTVHLMAQLRAQGFVLHRCKYDPKVQVEELDAALSQMLDEIPPPSELEEQSDVLDLAKFGEIIASTRHIFVDRIASIAPTLKHPDFQEESEWRAVRLMMANDAGMDYHIKGAVAIPHYKLRLDAVPGQFPIDEITVGPGPHQDLARRGLNPIVNEARVRIKVSQTPLRNL